VDITCTHCGTIWGERRDTMIKSLSAMFLNLQRVERNRSGEASKDDGMETIEAPGEAQEVRRPH
jgi:hypothetical protein